jgi:hypothetical protein
MFSIYLFIHLHICTRAPLLVCTSRPAPHHPLQYPISNIQYQAFPTVPNSHSFRPP